jgi:type IV pilus assembly protein PilV
VSVRTNEGFTIVEVIIAIVILAVGMLALATTSIVATTQVKIADMKTERSLAVQEVVEQLRAGPWTSVTTHAFANGTMAGSYRVWWRVTPINNNLRQVDIFTRGPGYISGQGWTTMDTDTFTVEIANAS